ncbi:unnamed protein product [Spirodela intermedia]|uniref:non-specific serine/threonine protein kinase n=2 Tax=Spirodela intermedia TaxID=51605 RepID=A0A7I8L2I4_SPIIN|nr:unnamed protein product [Spirodela intermedia]
MEGRMSFPPFKPWKGCPQPPCPLSFLFFCIFSVDCGFAGVSDYTDANTGVKYTGDRQFINTGENEIVSSNGFARRYGTLRSFPNGTRNCYKMSPVLSGSKYVIRAGFLYGNYDSQGFPPVFDLHIGNNFWTTVTTLSDDSVFSEIITVSRGVLIQVCLVNTGKGTPFISVLELRPLLDSMYPLVNTSQSLVNHLRWNYGMANQLRYPYDPFDRLWDGVANNFFTLNTSSEVMAKEGDAFQVPSLVLRSAVSESRTNYHLDTWLKIGTFGDKIYIVMHFAELQKLNSANESRRLNIYGKDGTVLLFPEYSPPYLTVDHKEIVTDELPRSRFYNISIKSTRSSTYSYIINAFESFIVRSMNESQTDDRDVAAIEDIKSALRLVKNWEGDPCSPKEYIWEGVNCANSEDSTSLRIISLNLSSSGLQGQIPSSIGNLTALTMLDLSDNNLTGPIPDIFGELSSLRFINLSGSEALGVIPQNLCKKISKGALSLRFHGINIYIILGVSDKQNKSGSTIEGNVQKREGVQFTYAEITQITHNFQHEIGKGGFGIVYLGSLKDGTMVAVKVLSSSSSQGSKEFEAEVLLLARVHHKNLVNLLGYCDDMQHLSLVYEYMDNGTLRDHLSGKILNGDILNWNQRVNIALQAAQGLDYLHSGCTPPIVHRDIKSNNILLNRELVAKISDFGLSRSFNNDYATHISTRLAGTPGYLDPEYYKNYRLNEKSDVYSFGIVLLEIMTGQPPHQNTIEKTHIVRWVHSLVQSGDIINIIDSRLQGYFDINRAWKIIEVAMSCTSTTSEERMTMSEVVMELKQCLNINELQIEFEDTKSSIQYSSGTITSGLSTSRAPLAR